MGRVSDIFIELEELGFSHETIEEAARCFPPLDRTVEFLKMYAEGIKPKKGRKCNYVNRGFIGYRRLSNL